MAAAAKPGIVRRQLVGQSSGGVEPRRVVDGDAENVQTGPRQLRRPPPMARPPGPATIRLSFLCGGSLCRPKQLEPAGSLQERDERLATGTRERLCCPVGSGCAGELPERGLSP